jgi:hypothetical protein
METLPGILQISGNMKISDWPLQNRTDRDSQFVASELNPCVVKS